MSMREENGKIVIDKTIEVPVEEVESKLAKVRGARTRLRVKKDALLQREQDLMSSEAGFVDLLTQVGRPPPSFDLEDLLASLPGPPEGTGPP